MFTSHKQISPPSLVLKLKISEVSQKWIPKAVELKRIPTHKKCKCKKFCSQTRLVGEIYSSDVIMHRGYWLKQILNWSERNFYTYSADIILQGNHWWHHKISAVFFRLGSQGEAKGPQVSETMMLVDNPTGVWSHDLLLSKPALFQQSSLGSSFVSLNKRYYSCRLIISCFKKFSCYRPTFLTTLDI